MIEVIFKGKQNIGCRELSRTISVNDYKYLFTIYKDVFYSQYVKTFSKKLLKKYLVMMLIVIFFPFIQNYFFDMLIFWRLFH